jgi:hypothetical protein
MGCGDALDLLSRQLTSGNNFFVRIAVGMCAVTPTIYKGQQHTRDSKRSLGDENLCKTQDGWAGQAMGAEGQECGMRSGDRQTMYLSERVRELKFSSAVKHTRADIVGKTTTSTSTLLISSQHSNCK